MPSFKVVDIVGGRDMGDRINLQSYSALIFNIYLRAVNYFKPISHINTCTDYAVRREVTPWYEAENRGK
jgi:hypothetical protein